jgi:tetratricopeptide (TPR) repeat protein
MEKIKMRMLQGKKKNRILYSITLLTLAIAVLGAGCARSQKERSRHDRMKEALTLYETGADQELNNDLQAARQAYEKSLEVSPRPIVHYRLGVVLAKLGEYEASLEHLNRALELVPSLTIAEKEKVRVKALMKVEGDVPPSPAVEPEAPAEVQPPVIEEEQIEETAKKQEAAVEEEPVKQPESPVETPQPAPAQEQAVSQEPVDAGDKARVELLLAQGFEAFQEGNTEAALKAYDEALMIYPDDARIHYNLGYIHQEQGDYRRAYLKYQRALEINPEYTRAWNNTGVVLEQLSRSLEALDCYDQAIDLGQLPDAYFNSALLLEKMGKLEAALERFGLYLEKGGRGEQAEEARKHIKRLERQF